MDDDWMYLGFLDGPDAPDDPDALGRLRSPGESTALAPAEPLTESLAPGPTGRPKHIPGALFNNL